jgi:hypothetical protein
MATTIFLIFSPGFQIGGIVFEANEKATFNLKPKKKASI